MLTLAHLSTRLSVNTVQHSVSSLFEITILPNLWSGAGVVMDNLSAHKVEGVKEMIEGVGGQVIYLSSYSCEFNPIEHLWWKLKSFVRRFAPKNEEAIRK